MDPPTRLLPRHKSMTPSAGQNHTKSAHNIIFAPRRGHGRAFYTPSDIYAPPVTKATDSDYGSDFDSDTENQLVAVLAEQFPFDASIRPLILESINQDAGNGESIPVARMPHPHPSGSQVSGGDFEHELARFADGLECGSKQPALIEYDMDEETADTVAQDQHPLRSPSVDSDLRMAVEVQADTRSPLERFRTKPRKPLSVTDLVSPAWCELQYWFTLTKHGKKKQTPAMRQGSKVHKVLEEQVHKTVQVDVTTREDTWGLKIWNAIQGLRTLRATGLTRELEIWGVIDGQVINGVIDELSYTPHEEMPEGEGKQSTSLDAKGHTPDSTQQIALDQFYRARGAGTAGDSGSQQSTAWVGDVGREKEVFITDVKTRGARSLPAGPSLRPTRMQLMLYHKLLSALAVGSVDQAVLFARYNVRPDGPFTDSFIAQVGSLASDFDEDVLDEDEEPLQDGVSELLQHNSLNQLWKLLISEYKRAIPMISEGTPAISDLIKAEFRRSANGSVLGSKVFRYDSDAIDAYVKSELQWWKGERSAVGVEIDEAFKCRICEFAESCDWRRNKVNEVMEKTRLNRSQTAPAEVKA